VQRQQRDVFALHSQKNIFAQHLAHQSFVSHPSHNSVFVNCRSGRNNPRITPAAVKWRADPYFNLFRNVKDQNVNRCCCPILRVEDSGHESRERESADISTYQGITASTFITIMHHRQNEDKNIVITDIVWQDIFPPGILTFGRFS